LGFSEEDEDEEEEEDSVMVKETEASKDWTENK
jgi:hypothetical protein